MLRGGEKYQLSRLIMQNLRQWFQHNTKTTIQRRKNQTPYMAMMISKPSIEEKQEEEDF